MKNDIKANVYVNRELCKGVDGCGICMHFCPKNVFDRSTELTAKGILPPEPVRIEDCTACMRCMIFCPDFAIVVEKIEDKKPEKVT